MSIHDDPPRDDTPTPIDPADIRPRDVVRASATFEVEQVTSDGTIYSTDGAVDLASENVEAFTWYLVHRPYPDAEAVKAIRSASYNVWFGEERLDPLPGLRESADILNRLREQGWDVTRRQS